MLTALAEKGIRNSNPFASGVPEAGGRGYTSPRDRVHACTLEAYAGIKSLSVAFLQNLGLFDLEILKTTVPESVHGTRVPVCTPARQDGRGCLHNREDTPHKPWRLVPTDPLPEDLEILPLRRPGGCIQRVQACRRNGGDTHPPPPKTTKGSERGGRESPLPQNGATPGR